MRFLVVAGACAAGVIGAVGPTRALAQDFLFKETFAAPPLTPGTEAGGWEDGWLDGENGWELSESFGPAAYGNFGQRGDGGVVPNWPHGDYATIGNVRNTGATAYAAKPLPALESGRISIALTDALSNAGVMGLYLIGQARTQYSGVLQDELPLWLSFGGLGGAASGDKFQVNVRQSGHDDITIFSTSSKTVDNRDLLWRTSLDGNNTNGDYAVLNIDFNARKNTSSIFVTTVNGNGSASSTAPVQVPFNIPVNSISRATLRSDASPDGSFGSLVWMGDVTISGKLAQPRPTDFGKQWVRSHPLTIMGAAHERGTPAVFDLAQYQNAGMSVVFSNKDLAVAQKAGAAGVPWHGHGWAQDYNDTYRFISHDNGGYMVFDEPDTAEDIAWAALNAQRMREQHPDVITYVNALPYFTSSEFPTYDSYLDAIVNDVKSDVLMFDNYPFRTNGSTDQDGWFYHVMTIRNKALAHNIPYWAWLQSYHYPGNDVRTPSESDTRYNAFTLLAAGYTGLNYFMYDNETTDFTGTFFDASGNPTPFYSYAAASNNEISRLGRSMRMLNSTDVRFVGGGVSSTPSGLSNWSAGAGSDPKLLAVSVVGTPTAGKDGLIGFFTDDAGQKYFMLSNLDHAANASAESRALSFSMTFDASMNELLRLNRLTGEPEKLVLSGHVLNLTLPGGTGDLLKYNTGFFAGIPGGDASLDGFVDISDLGILATNWQTAGTWSKGDFNLDGFIDISDLGILATYWQTGVGTASGQSVDEALRSLGVAGVTVPEPTSMTVLGFGWLLARRRMFRTPSSVSHRRC